jgi:hypothetical protein
MPHLGAMNQGVGPYSPVLIDKEMEERKKA